MDPGTETGVTGGNHEQTLCQFEGQQHNAVRRGYSITCISEDHTKLLLG